MYKQLRAFNVSLAGTTKYLCLANVRKGYGIAAKHAYALLDWQNNIQHKDQNFPAGVSVPVYFNWTGTVDGVRKNYGHIAVRLPDGRVWTDGKYFGNVTLLMNNYLAGGNPSYLGWGEMVNSVRVVENLNTPAGGDDMITNRDVLNILFERILGRKASDSEWNLYTSNKIGYERLIMDLTAGNKEADAFYSLALFGKTAQAQISDLQSKLAVAQAQASGVDLETKNLIKENNSIIKWIRDKLISIFK